MPLDRLAIPLHENPARQKFWRAVGFLVLVVGAVLLGYLIDRAIHYRTSPQRWPAEASVELRLIKTPRITRYVSEGLTGVQALPGTPWDVGEALSWSKRELVLYSNGQQIVGVVVDGEIPAEVLGSLAQWGWEVVPIGHRQLIVQSDSPDPGPTERNLNLWLTLPVFDGSITIKQDNTTKSGIPFRFSSATSLDFPINTEALIPSGNLALDTDTELTGSFSLPADLTGAFLPQTVPATFPGLNNLSQQASKHGVDVLLGRDTSGPAFVLSMPSTSLSLEELGEIATEGASLQNLSTSALTTANLSTGTEIRSAGEINVDVSNNDGIATAVAENATGDIFRLTQTSSQLIVSNRNPIIGLESATYSGSCMRHPRGFLAPQALSADLPGLIARNGHGLFEHLLSAEEIVYKKNWLRICW